MTTILVIVLATAAACELALRTPLLRYLSEVTWSARKVVSVLRSARISDHWKEKAILAYALRILRASSGLLVCLAVVTITVLAPVSMVDGSIAKGSARLFEPLSLVLMIVVASVWLWMRKRLFQ